MASVATTPELFDVPQLCRYRGALCASPYRYEAFIAQLGTSWTYVELVAFIEMYLMEDARQLDTKPMLRDLDSWMRRMCVYNQNHRFTRAAGVVLRTGYPWTEQRADIDDGITWMGP